MPPSFLPFFPDNVGSIKEFTFRPFGGGPRTCIGQRFAMGELKMAATMILSKMKFTKISETTLDYVPGDMFLLQASALKAKVEMR